MTDTTSIPLAVIGAGPAGLMAAEVAAGAGIPVTVFDRMPSAGRKFLMAGRGGLNLTHTEPMERFLGRYGTGAMALRPALARFDPARLRDWSAELGEPTVVGSSGRVFPKSFKASPLLRAWLRRLDRDGVRFHLRHRWLGWGAEGALRFETPEGPVRIEAGATVLALGGASWPRLGSDGGWTGILAETGLAVAPLRPSNCGFLVDWSPSFSARFAGHPLKGIALQCGEHGSRGEAVITAGGLEGGAVYALSPCLREAIAGGGPAMLHIALRPDLSTETIVSRLAAQPRKASLSTALRKALSLSPVAVALVQEARHRLDAAGPVADLINAMPVTVTAAAPIAGAISTAGGVRFADIGPDFMLVDRPGTFVAGEMLDWEAPTGGYLLQAAFATGAAAGQGAVAWLDGIADRDREGLSAGPASSPA